MSSLFGDYLRAIVHYWWIIVPGLAMPLTNLWRWHHPERKDIPLPYWLRLTIGAGALILAQFLAYKDSVKNLSNVITEKRDAIVQSNNWQAKFESTDKELVGAKQQLKDLANVSPRTVTRTLEPEKHCWMSSHFGFPNSTIKGAVTATAVILHCNYKIESPFKVVVEFDRDFLPGAMVLPDVGTVMGIGEGKEGKVYIGQVDNPSLLSEKLIIVTV